MVSPSIAAALLGLAALTNAPTVAAFQPYKSLGSLAALAPRQRAALHGATARAVATPPSTSHVFATVTATIHTSTGTSLASTASSSDEKAENKVDFDAISKYVAAMCIQMSLFAGTFKLLDLTLAQLGVDPSSVPFAAVTFLFYATALKSRVFNPLNNARPDRTKAVEGEGSEGFRDRVMPSWTPPGFVFPIMWLLIIGPIRAYSSALVFSTTGSFFHPALLSFVLHLTIGDIWNTINNTEKRYGASVIGVLGVVASVAFAASNYYAVNPLAGKLLGATGIWLVTASALITDTWRLNPRPDGIGDPLYPVVGESKTEFAWFSEKKTEDA